MSKYKIEISKASGWQLRNAVTLGVSVPSPNWQGDKLACLLAFVCTKFNCIRIDVTDALYRHTFMAEGSAPDEALAQANSLGSLWLAQHADIIENMPTRPVIIRWAEWYKHPDYELCLNGFCNAYEKNALLKEAIHKDVYDFYRRRARAPSDREFEASKNYFLEELAVITLQSRALPSLRVYPGDELNCLNIVRQNLIPEAPLGLENEQFGKIRFVLRSVARGSAPLLERHLG